MKKFNKFLVFLICPLLISSCNLFKKSSNENNQEQEEQKEEVTKEYRISDFLTSEKINLIDLNGKTTYDLSKGDKFINLYTEDAKGPLSYSLISMVTGKETFVESNIVDFSKVQKAYYVVGIYQEVNNKKLPIYAYYADFYDKNDDFVWNTFNYNDDIDQIMVKGDARDDNSEFNVDTNDYYRATNAHPQATTVTAGKGVDGEPGNFYQIHSSEAGYLGYAEGVLINFAPLHSSSYYRLFDEDEYELSYDLYIKGGNGIDQKTGVNVNEEDIYCLFATISEKPSGADFEQPYNRYQYYGVNSWKRVTLPVKDYFSSNSHLEEVKKTHSNTKTGWKWMVDKESIWGSDVPVVSSLTNVFETDVFIGNFQIKRTHYHVEDLGLIDKKTTSNLDLSAYENSTFELYRLSNGNEVFVKQFSEQQLALSSYEGQYIVRVNKNGSLDSKISFDVFNSDDQPIWGDDPTGCITTLWGQYEDYETSNMTLDVLDNSTVDLLKDKTAKYYKLGYTTTDFFRAINFMPAPIHSDAYYQRYANSLADYGISFEMLINDNNGEVPWINGSVKQDYTPSSDDYYYIVTNIHNSGTYPIKYIHSEYNTNNIYSYTLSLDVLYECWNSYNNAIEHRDNTNDVVAGSSLVSIATNRVPEVGKYIEYYVGNINYFKYNLNDKFAYLNISPNTLPTGVSIKDNEESYNLSTYLDEKNLAIYNKYKDSVTTSLTLSQNGVVKYSFNSISFKTKDTVEAGNYELKLTFNGYDLLTGNIYVYHYDAELDGLEIVSDISNSTNLVNVASSTSFSLLNLLDLSECNKSVMSEKSSWISYTLTNKFETEVSANSLSIDLTGVQKTIYDIVVKIKGFKLYTGKIDFYDLTSITDSDWFNVNNVNVYTDNNVLTVSNETYVPHHGINGSYVKITNPNNPGQIGSFVVSLAPTHSKEYYNLDAVKTYFNSKELSYKALGYTFDGSSYSSDDKYMLKNIAAARNDQSWLVLSDGGNFTLPSDAPLRVPDGTHGHLYFTNFVKMYDEYVKYNNATYSILGMTTTGMQLLCNGELCTGLEFSIFVGNFAISNL